MPFPKGARILDVRIGADKVVAQLQSMLSASEETDSDCFSLRPLMSPLAYHDIAHLVARAVDAKALELRRTFIGSRRGRLPFDNLAPSVPACVDPQSGKQTPENFSFRVLDQSGGAPILEYRPCSFRIEGTSAVMKDLTTGATEEGPRLARLELGGFTSIQKHTGDGADLLRAIALLLVQDGTCDEPKYEGRLIVRPAAHDAEGNTLYVPFWEIPVQSTREVVMADTLLYLRRRFIRKSVPGCCTWMIGARFYTVGAFFFDAITGSLAETFPNDSFFSKTNRSSTDVSLASSCQTFDNLERAPTPERSGLDALLRSTRGRGLEDTLKDVGLLQEIAVLYALHMCLHRSTRRSPDEA